MQIANNVSYTLLTFLGQTFELVASIPEKTGSYRSKFHLVIGRD